MPQVALVGESVGELGSQMKCRGNSDVRRKRHKDYRPEFLSLIYS
jgi:hypothetical protein